ncbi:MAG TPA: 3-octaprenyl-4-hydroxybenzoate carboxy-lyase, partial [Bacteroidia bacterium]
MAYKNLLDCLIDLEKNGQLLRVKEEVNPELEMAAIHLRVHEAGGKAILFEKIKGCNYQAASNIFGTIERSKFIFREHFAHVQKLIEIKNNPAMVLKHPFKYVGLVKAALSSRPKKVNVN